MARYTRMRLGDDAAPAPQTGEGVAPQASDIEAEMADIQDADSLLASDFAMDLSGYTRPPAEPDDAYTPPSTIEEAEGSLKSGEERIREYQRQIETLAQETRQLQVMDRASAREVKRRAEIIAKGRKDVELVNADIATARAQLEAAKQAANEDPGFWQSALGYAGDALGVVGKIIENSPLAGISETFLGFASYGAEAASAMLDVALGKNPTGEFKDYDSWDVAGAYVTSPWSYAGGAKDGILRERGREFAKKVGRSLAAVEEIALDVPVLGTALKVAQAVGSGGLIPLFDVAAQALGASESEARDLRYQIAFEMATDPTNIVDFGGVAITKLGRLRQLAKVNRGVLETAAKLKTVDGIPELAKLKNFDTGSIVNDLRKAGMSGEEAAKIGATFDTSFKNNLKDLRKLASENPREWAAQVKPYIERAPAGEAKTKQLETLGKIGEFGEKVDPILGMDFREQAALGQRLKVWDSMFKRFGDKPWFKKATFPVGVWAYLSGESLRHDISDNPALLELYYANRMFKADMGAEMLRYQQDVAEGAAKYLNSLNPEQAKQVMEALPELVENPSYRRVLKSGLVPAEMDASLQATAIELAEHYETSAETLRAIQNRFGLKVADLAGDLGYFVHQFSPELQDHLLQHADARAILFGETTARSREALSTAFLPEEKARKFKDIGFHESEKMLREMLKVPENIPIWSRDAFKNLSDKAARSVDKAALRYLYANMVDAFDVADDATAAKLNGLVDAEKAMARAKAEAHVDAAREVMEKAGADAAATAKRGYDDAVEQMGKANPDGWSADAKAKWLEERIKEFKPQGYISGLEVMRRANAKLPDDWQELTRLASAVFSPHEAHEASRLIKGLFWQHVDTPSKAWQALKEVKAWFQRAMLARPGSITKDWQGTLINSAMSGNVGYLDRARKELGTFTQWQKGQGGSQLVNRLRGVGVLRTQVDEALSKQSVLESLLPGAIGRQAGRWTKLGMIGGTIQGVTEGVAKAGKKLGLDLKPGKTLAEAVSKTTDTMMDTRVYLEEVNRVASAMKALAEGSDFAGAVQDVYKWWGKFDEMSKLDRKVLSQLLLFWTWQARSIPIAVRHLLAHPVRSRWLLTAMSGNVDDEERAPRWLKRMGAWGIGRDENGNFKALNVGGSSYFGPLMAMLQGASMNQALQGHPMDAVSGLLMDVARATPPYVQAVGEAATQFDVFTEKPWWRDRNAKTGSNAKAPTALWWFYSDPDDNSFGSGVRSKITEFLGLRAVHGARGSAYLTMDPAKAWLFGLVPGLDPVMNDVSAFFTPPAEGSARPGVDVVKGLSRMAGTPIYEVPLETGKQDVYQARQALLYDADKLAGGALYAENGQLRPNTKTARGRELASFIERAENQAKLQGATQTQAHMVAMQKVNQRYPTEARYLMLYDRIEAWEKYLIALEKGDGELDEQIARSVMMVARRSDYNRVRKLEAGNLKRTGP